MVWAVLICLKQWGVKYPSSVINLGIPFNTSLNDMYIAPWIRYPDCLLRQE